MRITLSQVKKISEYADHIPAEEVQRLCESWIIQRETIEMMKLKLTNYKKQLRYVKRKLTLGV